MPAVDPVTVARTTAALRAVYGGVSVLATGRVLRLVVGGEPDGTLLMMTRSLAIRNLVFGVGAYRAATGATATATADTASTADGPASAAALRGWLALWLASDLADVAAGVTGRRHVGRRGAAVAAAVPLPLVAAGAWAVRRLAATA